MEAAMAQTALVVGVSGIVGRATAAHLAAEGWDVLGLARRPVAQTGVTPISAGLQDEASLSTALADVKPEAVFITTWSRQATEADNIRVNAAMVRNVLDGLRPAGSLRHVALVTGLKHYLGPFEAYGKGSLPQTPFREDQGRLDIENFYYAQEDEVFAAAKRDGAGACDGFWVCIDVYEDGIGAFVDGVVPILQERGLFHTDYEGSTLRDHLGAPAQYGLDDRVMG
jgi:nucleoside-diphosphate-sugar epimerase